MIKKTLFDENLKAQLRARARDRATTFLLSQDQVRGVVLNGTRMVQEMRANHELGVLETLVLGHAYLAGALMAAGLKGNDRISLLVDCQGPIRGLVVEANAFGEVRGHLKTNAIPVSAPLERFDLAPFFGEGILSVTRHLEGAKQPFTGKVSLVHGSLAKDLTEYYMTSEQIPTAFHLSIQFDAAGAVTGAAGLFLQVMPGVADETVAGLETLVRSMPSMGAAVAEGKDPVDMVRDTFAQRHPRFLADHRVAFFCHCNEEKIRAMLALLPQEDLDDMVENGPFPLEIRCHHCNTAYGVDRDTLKQIRRLRGSNN